MHYYLVKIHGDIEPELIGPFATEDQLEQRARTERADDPALNNGLYGLTVSSKGLFEQTEANIEPGIFSWAGGFFDGDFDEK